MTTIPIIDLAPYFAGTDKARVAKQINAACLDVGFFTIRNHNIPLEVVLAAHEAATGFFDGSLSEKNRVKAVDGMGFIGRNQENLAASLDNDSVVDVKESLNLNLPLSAAVWPQQPPTLRPAAEAYYDELIELAHHLMRLFALALELPETWFDDKIDSPRTILRLLNYPALSTTADNSTRAGAHTDYGTLTILWSPDPRGLQAQDRSGNWVDVTAPPEHFIINIGDLMMNWTNDRWLSTLHRVVPHPETAGKRRRSMAFFHNPNPNALIRCLESCFSADNPPKYSPILAKEHLEMKIAKSLGKSIKLT